jgi:electron transfer flavoprotein alpha subunit
LADRVGGSVGALLFGKDDAGHVATLASYGVDQVLVFDVPAGASYSPDTAAAAVAAAVEERRPWGLFVPATECGRDWAPRLAARLGLGLTGDAIGLDINVQSRLVALKPAFGGNMVADIYSKTHPQMATVRPGMLDLGEPAKGRKAEVVTLRPSVGTPKSRWLKSHVLVDHDIAPLERAAIVVGVGMGVGGPDGVALAKALALALGAAMCGTRRVCDKGWLPRQLQVGLTGKAVNAGLYIAAGIRGGENHTVGLKRAGTIVAINNDPQAQIFAWADVGIVGDCAKILPALTQALARERGA